MKKNQQNKDINSLSSVNNDKAAFVFMTGMLIACVCLIAGIVFLFNANSSKGEQGSTSSDSRILENGKQEIYVTARGGYSPSRIFAKADKDTTLKVTTKNTFDCSSAFTIPSLKINKNLPVTGVTEFNIPPQKPGTKLDAACTMGMYSFTIEFS